MKTPSIVCMLILLIGFGLAGPPVVCAQDAVGRSAPKRMRLQPPLELKRAVPRTVNSTSSSSTADLSRETRTRPPEPVEPNVDAAVPRTQMHNPDAVAVVIGNQQYEDADVPPVEYALRGAEAVRAYLTHGLGFREENILFEANASKSALERLFGTAMEWQGQLYNFLKPGRSDVFIYYQGHGAPDLDDGRSYLVPSDADPHFLRLNGYPLDVLFGNLAQLPVRSMTVVLDACFSGFAESGSLVRGASPALLRVENPILAMENAVVFTAAEATQVSSWYDDKRHGLFTYFFLRGLQGAADGAAGGSDGRVTVAEMDAYLQANVPAMARRLRNRVQTPQLLGTETGRVLISFVDE